MTFRFLAGRQPFRAATVVLMSCLCVVGQAASGSAGSEPLVDTAEHCVFRSIEGSLAAQTDAIVAIDALNTPGQVAGNARLELIDELVIDFQRLDMQRLALPFAITLTNAAPDDADYWSDAAISLAKLNQTEKALDYLQHALALNPDDRHHLMLLGDLKLKQGDSSAARTAYERAFSKAADDSGRSYALLALYAFWLEYQKDEAGRMLASHMKQIHSEDWPFPILKTLSGTLDEAALATKAVNRKELKDCSFARTRLFESLYYRANVFRAEGDKERARRYYTAATHLLANGDNTEMLMLDYRLQSLGMTEPAIKEQAEPHNPKDDAPGNGNTKKARET